MKWTSDLLTRGTEQNPLAAPEKSICIYYCLFD